MFLKRNGAAENIGINGWAAFLLVSLLTGAFMGFLGYRAMGKTGIFLGVIPGALTPYLLIKIMNEDDNDQIFRDLRAIYDCMLIQQGAGIYIAQTLKDCHIHVKNKRFKEAMKKLSMDISSDKDVLRAVSEVAESFENEYTDQFAAVVIQAVNTGHIVDMLGQINRQLGDIEELMNEKYERKIENKMLIIEVLLFLGILAMAVYGLMMGAMQSLYNI